MAPRKGRRVLVAGATGTLGWEICGQLVQRGDRVLALARNPDRLEELASNIAGIEPMAVDLAAPSGARVAAHGALAFGPIDDVVFALGGFERASLDLLEFDGLVASFAVHAAAPLLLVRELAASLEASGGAVVALSDEGVGRPFPNHAAYLAAKGALEAGMMALALELRERVRINVLRLGVVTADTESAAIRRNLEARSLTGRTGTAVEVGQVVLTMLDAPWLSGRIWTVG
jgi:pteridine reductase